MMKSNGCEEGVIDGYFLTRYYWIKYAFSLGMKSVEIFVKLEGGLSIYRCLILGGINGNFFVLLQEEIGTSCNTASDMIEMEMSNPVNEFIGSIGTAGIYIVIFIQNSKTDIWVVWSMEF
jgi:hypothetical protein